MSRLIILARHGSVRQVNIEGRVTTIGRDPECGVQIDSLGVSRRHATIHWSGDRFVLTDLESFNGTFVNSERIWEHALQNGDAIAMGECQLRFLYSSKALPSADALRLVTRADDLHDWQVARERSDWAAFFRRSRTSTRGAAVAHRR
ncbi:MULTISPECIES: FHA domain-containing protein [unclassified Variovorax]|uniref:FHA domain-containing protein n=1 Tax=unclassified Variovorax TaxID=663243 RepID=UPI00076D5D09|nr:MULTISPECIES: FHA domain-containing protein [unclassified Variovorax]KWT92126.1 FHA-domain-containing protein [Variovorax sp. WDL1]PNG46971.1 Glycogen accumulation regulator GarA [Variovorax sp. B2]PNG48378.1 Glycogen accumulation regulator GarA [Variovorax sp. B4]VTV14814.1 Glycogen accumulation regulator GarA [Variovorax sp. WDL1]